MARDRGQVNRSIVGVKLPGGPVPPVTEDPVTYTATREGVEGGRRYIEQRRGGVKLGVRSRRDFDCARLAARFGPTPPTTPTGRRVPERTGAG